jgi:hypothetical protein
MGEEMMASGDCDDSAAPAAPDMESVLHVAMIRTAMRVARGLPEDDLEPMREPFLGVWCADSEGGEV